MSRIKKLLNITKKTNQNLGNILYTLDDYNCKKMDNSIILMSTLNTLPTLENEDNLKSTKKIDLLLSEIIYGIKDYYKISQSSLLSFLSKSNITQMKQNNLSILNKLGMKKQSDNENIISNLQIPVIYFIILYFMNAIKNDYQNVLNLIIKTQNNIIAKCEEFLNNSNNIDIFDNRSSKPKKSNLFRGSNKSAISCKKIKFNDSSKLLEKVKKKEQDDKNYEVFKNFCKEIKNDSNIYENLGLENSTEEEKIIKIIQICLSIYGLIQTKKKEIKVNKRENQSSVRKFKNMERSNSVFIKNYSIKKFNQERKEIKEIKEIENESELNMKTLTTSIKKIFENEIIQGNEEKLQKFEKCPFIEQQAII